MKSILEYKIILILLIGFLDVTNGLQYYNASLIAPDEGNDFVNRYSNRTYEDDTFNISMMTKTDSVDNINSIHRMKHWFLDEKRAKTIPQGRGNVLKLLLRMKRGGWFCGNRCEERESERGRQAEREREAPETTRENGERTNEKVKRENVRENHEDAAEEIKREIARETSRENLERINEKAKTESRRESNERAVEARERVEERETAERRREQTCRAGCWAGWAAWSSCSKPCGAHGTKTRRRNQSQRCGTGCPGDSRQIQSCNRFCYNGGTPTTGGTHLCACKSEYQGSCCDIKITQVRNL